MGFDLQASNGTYFRAAFDEWPRLWSLVEHACADLLSVEDIKSGKANDGHFITAPKAAVIADRLTELLTGNPARREALEGATAQDADIAAQQRIAEHLRRRGGYRSFHLVPVPHEPDTYELVPEDVSVPEDTGQYPFSWELVREFAEFCRASDGFRIT